MIERSIRRSVSSEMRPHRQNMLQILSLGLLCALVTAVSCGRSGHTFVSEIEGDIIVARTTGGPLLDSPPFRLELEVVFGDPSHG